MKSVALASWITRRPILAAMAFAVTILLAFAAGGIYVIISLRPEELIISLRSKELGWADLLLRSPEPDVVPVLRGAGISVPGGAWRSAPSPTPVSRGARISVPGGAWHSGPVSDGLLMVLVTLEVGRHDDGRPICIGLRKSEADSEEPGKRLSIDMPDFLFEWISPHFPKLVSLNKCVVNFRGMRGIIRNETFPDAHLIVLEEPEAVFGGRARGYYRVSAQSYIPGDIHSYGRTYLIVVDGGVANLIDMDGFRAY